MFSGRVKKQVAGAGTGARQRDDRQLQVNEARQVCAAQACVVRYRQLHYEHWRRQGGGQGAQPPPQWPRKKEFFVKIEGFSTIMLGRRLPSS